MGDDHRPLAVFDLDGTLADAGRRRHHPERPRRDWNAFFAAAVDNPPPPEGIWLLLAGADECEIGQLTGRPERCRRDPRAWLVERGLPEGALHMRRNDDRRPARHTEPEVLKRLGREREVRMLVDEDARVCEAAERAGFAAVGARRSAVLPPFEVAQGHEGRSWSPRSPGALPGRGRCGRVARGCRPGPGAAAVQPGSSSRNPTFSPT